MTDMWKTAWKGPAVVIPFLTVIGLVAAGSIWVADAENKERLQDAERVRIVSDFNTRIESIELRISDNVARFNEAMTIFTESRIDSEVNRERMTTVIDVTRELQKQVQELQIEIRVLSTELENVSPTVTIEDAR